MALRTAYQTALLIHFMFLTSKLKRARLSKITVKKVAGRQVLRTAFISDLTNELDDQGFLFFENNQGFAIIQWTSFDGAPSITVHIHLDKRIRAKLRTSPDEIFLEIESQILPKDEMEDMEEE